MTSENFKMAWTLSVSVILLACYGCHAQDFEKKQCMSGNEEAKPPTIDFKCPPNTKIRLEEAIFGRNKWDSCSHTVGDCTEQIDLFDSCRDTETCSVVLDKTYSKKCGGYATFLRVLYDCVSDIMVTTETQIRPKVYSPKTKLYAPPIAIRDNSPNNPDQVSNTDEAGLIAGCAVAVVITVIMLLLAIYLVVKRLFRPPPSEEDKGTDGSIPRKPDIVIFDIICFCVRQSQPEKRRPVADQNQNIENAASLSITDRPVPLGEVTEVTVNEFRQSDTGTVNTPLSNQTTSTVVASNAPSVLSESRPNQNYSNQTPAIGLPNTRSSTAC